MDSHARLLVLLVEDNPGDARLIEHALMDSVGDYFDLEIVDRLATAIQRLHHGKVDAMLLDLALPDSHGEDTFTQAKFHAPDLPIIVLTGLGDEARAIGMVQQGAQDYLIKGEMNGNVLSRSIRYAIERAHTAQHIRKLNMDLEEKVRERTRELEVANKELEAFSYSVSHDLRAPIRQIEGFAEIIAETHANQLDEDGTECFRRICDAAHRMTVMTNNLLKLAQISKQRLQLSKTSLKHLVDLTVRELSEEIGSRRIEWKIGDLPSVECDQDLMKQVFANLIANAVKYTGRRETAIIEIGQTCIDGATVIFVADNGAGLNMQYADKMFQAFQRFHHASEFEGTGVGLSTVQRILQRHGCRIWAESEPDKGATFFFTVREPGAEHASVA